MVNKANLDNALANITRFSVARKKVSSIFENALVLSRDGGLSFSAFDGDVGLTVFLNGEGAGDIALMVPARLTADIVKSIKADQVDLRQEGWDLVIRAGDVDARVNGGDPQEFPAVPVAGDAVCRMSAKDMIALAEVSFAVASANSPRPALEGVKIEIAGETATAVASDGYRMAVRSVPLPGNTTTAEFLVPAKAMREIGRLAGEEAVSIERSSAFVVFRTSSFALAARVIDHPYPAWRDVLPRKALVSVEVDVSKVIEAIRRCQIIAKNDSNGITFSLEDQALVVASSANGFGEIRNRLDVGAADGTIRQTFKVQYMLDAFSRIRGDKASIAFTNGPCVVRDGESVHLIMPYSSF